MIEIPAKGTTGFLLYSPFTGDYFYRVYNPLDKSKFKDYSLQAEDIEIEVVDEHLVLIESPDPDILGKLDYSAKALGQCDSLDS